jgi:hypothetical protein
MEQRTFNIDCATFRCGGLCVVANGIGYDNDRVASYASAPAEINIVSEKF